MSAVAALTRPVDVAGRRLPPLGIILLAVVGAVFLLVVATSRWATPSDEHAYWLAARRLLAGEPLYDPSATSVTPYAYWYPPVVAQVLVPVALVLPELVFTAAWTLLMLGCLWWLAGRDVLTALALVAFPPVAVEFWFRNVHLVLAVLIVLGVRHSGAWFAVAAAIKIGPGIGLVYLAFRRRYRELALALAVGAGLLAASVVLSPDAWRQFAQILTARGPADVSGFLPVPYAARVAVALLLVVVAARAARWAGPVLVVAVTVALPTLWFTALSTLIAIVPLLPGRSERAARGV